MASEKLVDWWNHKLFEIILVRIRLSDDPKDTFFFWGQLVWQELRMWESIGKSVNSGDLDFIVNRRGFSMFQRQFLIEGLENLGLWEPDGPGELRT